MGAISKALRQELLEDAIRITQWSNLSSLRTETPTRARGWWPPLVQQVEERLRPPKKRERVLEWQEPHPRTHEKVT